MRLASVREGDIVQVDVKGRRAFAFVSAINGRELEVKPLPGQTFTWAHVKARQVIAHYAKRKG